MKAIFLIDYRNSASNIVIMLVMPPKRTFEQYLNKIVKIQQSKKPEGRTKVEFLFERANILSKEPARKIGSKIEKPAF